MKIEGAGFGNYLWESSFTIEFMVKKISFKNFKLFKDWQEMEIRPLTILIGKNSSGKSSLAKLLTLVEGSLAGEQADIVMMESKGVELGSEFRDLIYRKDAQRTLDFIIENESEKLTLSVISTLHPIEKQVMAAWRFEKNREEPKEFQNCQELEFRGFVPQVPDFDRKELALRLRTEYLGPLRLFPPRSFERPRSSKTTSLGITGQGAYELLLNDCLSEKKGLIERIGEIFEQQFEGWKLQINKDKEPFYQFEISRDSGRLKVNLRDVGLGMSQALPVVTAAIMPLNEHTLFVIEQPELHLHPAAHGSIAQILAESTNDPLRRYVIETHSQQFVLRLRRLVAEGILKPEMLVIYYVDFDEELNESSLKRIDVDYKGAVSYWPEGIFSESLDEVLAIRTATTKP